MIFITPALWSVNALVARKAPGVIEPHMLAMMRWLLASFLFALINPNELWVHRRQIFADWKQHLVLGALGMWICGAWVYIAARTTSGANIGLLYSISPILIVLGSALWLHERFRLTQTVGLAMALLGVLHVVVKGQWTALTMVQFAPGDGWLLAATLSWSLYALLLKKWPSPLGAGSRLAVISLAGAVVNLPFAVWEFVQSAGPAMTHDGFMLALIAAVIPGVGAYLAYSVMQRELGAARVSVVMYLSPLYTGLISWLALGEALQPYHATGILLILPGIYLVTQSKNKLN